MHEAPRRVNSSLDASIQLIDESLAAEQDNTVGENALQRNASHYSDQLKRDIQAVSSKLSRLISTEAGMQGATEHLNTSLDASIRLIDESMKDGAPDYSASLSASEPATSQLARLQAELQQSNRDLERVLAMNKTERETSLRLSQEISRLREEVPPKPSSLQEADDVEALKDAVLEISTELKRKEDELLEADKFVHASWQICHTGFEHAGKATNNAALQSLLAWPQHFLAQGREARLNQLPSLSEHISTILAAAIQSAGEAESAVEKLQVTLEEVEAERFQLVKEVETGSYAVKLKDEQIKQVESDIARKSEDLEAIALSHRAVETSLDQIKERYDNAVTALEEKEQILHRLVEECKHAVDSKEAAEAQSRRLSEEIDRLTFQMEEHQVQLQSLSDVEAEKSALSEQCRIAEEKTAFAELQLKEINEEKDIMLDNIKELSEKREGLEAQQRTSQQEYAALEAEYHAAKNTLEEMTVLQQQQAVEAVEAEAQHKAATDERTSLEDELQQLQATYQAQSVTLEAEVDRLQQLEQQLRVEIAEHERRNEALTEEVAASKKTLLENTAGVSAEVNQLQQQVTDLTAQLAETREEVEREHANSAAGAGKIAELEEALREVKLEKDALEDAMLQLQMQGEDEKKEGESTSATAERIAAMEQEIGTLTAQLAEAREEVEREHANRTAGAGKIAELEEALREVKLEKDALEDAMLQLQMQGEDEKKEGESTSATAERIAAMEQEIGTLTTQLAETQEEVEKLQAIEAEYTSKLAEAESALSRLQSEQETMSASWQSERKEHQTAAVESLRRLAVANEWEEKYRQSVQVKDEEAAQTDEIIAMLRSEIDQLQQSIHLRSESSQSANDQLGQLRGEITRLVSELEQSKSNQEQLQEEIQKLMHRPTNNNVSVSAHSVEDMAMGDLSDADSSQYALSPSNSTPREFLMAEDENENAPPSLEPPSLMLTTTETVAEWQAKVVALEAELESKEFDLQQEQKRRDEAETALQKLRKEFESMQPNPKMTPASAAREEALAPETVALREEMVQLTRTVEDLKRGEILLQGQLTERETECKAAQREVYDLQAQLRRSELLHAQNVEGDKVILQQRERELEGESLQLKERLTSAQNEVARLEAHVLAFNRDLLAAQTEKEAAEKQLEEWKKTYRRDTQELKESHEKSLRNLQADLVKYSDDSVQMERYRRESQQKTSELERVMREKQVLRQQFDSMDDKFSALHEEIMESTREKERLREQLQRAMDRNRRLPTSPPSATGADIDAQIPPPQPQPPASSSTFWAQERSERLQKENANLQAEVQRLQTESLTQQSEGDDKEIQLATLRQRLEIASAEAQKWEKKCEKLSESLRQLESRVSSKFSDLSHLQQQLANAQDVCRRLSEKRAELKAELKGEKRARKRAEEELEGLRRRTERDHERMISGEKESIRLSSQMQHLEQDLQHFQRENSNLRSNLTRLSAATEGMKSELDQAISARNEAKRDLLHEQQRSQHEREHFSPTPASAQWRSSIVHHTKSPMVRGASPYPVPAPSSRLMYTDGMEQERLLSTSRSGGFETSTAPHTSFSRPSFTGAGVGGGVGDALTPRSSQVPADQSTELLSLSQASMQEALDAFERFKKAADFSDFTTQGNTPLRRNL